MPIPAAPLCYAFLVRCWHVPGAEAPAAWRFEVREAPAEHPHRFSNLEQLKAFIAATLDEIAAGNERGDWPEGGSAGGAP